MKSFSLCELMILREELACSIDNLLRFISSVDSKCLNDSHLLARYRRLVRLYDMVCIMSLDMLDELHVSTAESIEERCVSG